MNKEKISRKNRVLECVTTGREITVKPDRYLKLVNFFGDDKKVQKNFISYHVEMEARKPTLHFWFSNCLEMKRFKQNILTILTNYYDSDRKQDKLITLQKESFELFDSVNIKRNQVEFIQSSDETGRFVSGIKIVNIPFLNTYIITL